MPTSTVNGWTGSNLLPSSTVVASILGRNGSPANGPAAPATNTATQGSNPFAGNAFSGFLNAIYGNNAQNLFAGYPNVLSQMGGPGPAGGGGGGGGPILPPGWNSGGNGGGYNGAMPNGRGLPVLTPEQSYSQYLLSRGGADSSTPMGDFLGNAYRQGLNLTAGDPFGFNLNPNTRPVGGIGLPNDANSVLGTYVNNLNLLASHASPYAYSYGAPAAQAPAQTPAWGYPTNYGVAPPGRSNNVGQGFGFG
jgi:hypothetical protein